MPPSPYKPIRVSHAAQILGVSSNTVRNWCASGRLEYGLSAAGQKVFDFDYLERFRNEALGIERPDKTIISVHYARSSSGEDVALETQIKALEVAYGTPTYVITDKSSGLNGRRVGLNKIYALVRGYDHDTEDLVIRITNADRLTRFGYRYLQEYFDSHGVRLECLNDEEIKEPEQALLSDFMALIASFSGKFYRLRGYAQQRKMLHLAQEEVSRRESR